MYEGHRIFAGRDAGGHRDFLEDRPIHAGDGIEMWIGGHWIQGRYESDVPRKAGFFVTRSCDTNGQAEATIAIDRSTMRFRWPPRFAGDDRDTLDSRLARAIWEAQRSRQALRDIRSAAQRGVDPCEDESAEEAAERRFWVLKEVVDEAKYGLGY